MIVKRILLVDGTRAEMHTSRPFHVEQLG